MFFFSFLLFLSIEIFDLLIFLVNCVLIVVNSKNKENSKCFFSFASLRLALALSKRTAQIWFQNARARMKKKPCATTSSPPTYAGLIKTNLNLIDPLQINNGKSICSFFSSFLFHSLSFVEKQHDVKTFAHLNPHHRIQWSPGQTSPSSSLIYDAENSNDDYSTGYI